MVRKTFLLQKGPRENSWLLLYSWEQREAKQLCQIGTGKSNTQDQVPDGSYPFFIRSDTPVRSNKYLYDCEAVITIGDGNIGRVFHYVNGKFDLHQRCYKMVDFREVTGKYFFYFFSTHFYDRAMKMTAKATVDSVRLEMISEMEICFPGNPDEQDKIAEFFTGLDRLITLHQRVYFQERTDQTINGHTKTDSWEQRELGENCEITTGGTPTTSNSDYWNPKEIPWLSSGEVHKKRISATDDKISRLGLENSSARWVKPCSVLVALAGQGKTRGTVAINEIALTTNQSIAAIYPEEHDAEFLFQNLESRYEELRAISSADGSRGGLNKHLLSAVTIPYAETREQQKIGIFFRDLDSLITLHQREYLLFEVLLC